MPTGDNLTDVTQWEESNTRTDFLTGFTTMLQRVKDKNALEYEEWKTANRSKLAQLIGTKTDADADAGAGNTDAASEVLCALLAVHDAVNDEEEGGSRNHVFHDVREMIEDASYAYAKKLSKANPVATTLLPEKTDKPTISISQRIENACCVAYEEASTTPTPTVGIGIAGNWGRLGGNCIEYLSDQKKYTYSRIHPNHRTQEESVVSNMVAAQMMKNARSLKWGTLSGSQYTEDEKTKLNTAIKEDRLKLYNDTVTIRDHTTVTVGWYGTGYTEWTGATHTKAMLRGPPFLKDDGALEKDWGLCDPSNTSTDVHQTTNNHSPDKYKTAVSFNGSVLNQPKGTTWDWETSPKPVVAVVVAGPNNGRKGRTDTSTMTRTIDRDAANYEVFRQGVQNALVGMLTEMNHKECTVAVVPAVACGLYAGNHDMRIRYDFMDVLDDAVREFQRTATTITITIRKVICAHYGTILPRLHSTALTPEEHDAYKKAMISYLDANNDNSTYKSSGVQIRKRGMMQGYDWYEIQRKGVWYRVVTFSRLE